MARQFIPPCHIEVFCGPMKSGKSEEVIHRLKRLEMDHPKGKSVRKRKVGSTDVAFDVSKVA